jgi:HNH endonuclease
VSISSSLRQKVRQKAVFLCEYCEVSETDSGGELTIDHFKPQSQNGDDGESNLVYCCFRCNTYKSDYWNSEPNQIRLFNPRTDKRDEHFWLSESGVLFALTEVGEFTIELLRLNRKPLITKRRQDFQKLEEHQILEQTNRAVETLIRLSQQQRELLKKQQILLEEQRRLIDYLFKK